MPTPVPPVLFPYLSDASPGSLLLLTSVLSAPANWLIVRSISAALHIDQSQHQQAVGHQNVLRESAGRKVVFLSLLRPLSLWIEIGKKAGLDISSLVAQRRLIYINGLDVYGGAEPAGRLPNISTLQTHTLEEVKNAVQHAIEACDKTAGAEAVAERHEQQDSILKGPVLIIDGLDFLIPSQPDVRASRLLQMLTQVRQRFHNTILTVSSDGPLLHNNSAAAAPLEREHQAFVASLAHQSQLVVQLRDLDTGIAKDVSGVIRISHGGVYEDDTEKQEQPEGEWLYKVSGDGSVNVWGRGE